MFNATGFWHAAHRWVQDGEHIPWWAWLLLVLFCLACAIAGVKIADWASTWTITVARKGEKEDAVGL